MVLSTKTECRDEQNIVTSHTRPQHPSRWTSSKTTPRPLLSERLPQPGRRREVAVHPEERAGREDPGEAGGACPAQEGTWPQVRRRGESKSHGGALSQSLAHRGLIETDTNVVYRRVRAMHLSLAFIFSLRSVLLRSSPVSTPKSSGAHAASSLPHVWHFLQSEVPLHILFLQQGRGWNPLSPKRIHPKYVASMHCVQAFTFCSALSYHARVHRYSLFALFVPVRDTESITKHTEYMYLHRPVTRRVVTPLANVFSYRR